MMLLRLGYVVDGAMKRYALLSMSLADANSFGVAKSNVTHVDVSSIGIIVISGIIALFVVFNSFKWLLTMQ